MGQELKAPGPRGRRRGQDPGRAIRTGLAAVVAAAALAAVAVPTAAATDGELRVRKSVMDLTAQEKRDFVAAVLALKKARSPYKTGLSYYDQFVSWHKDLMRCDFTSDPMLKNIMRGHRGPMFLPWHRQFVLLFENALRDVSGKPITVPYWDWTVKASAEVVFSDDFMSPGGKREDGWVVKSGPFAADSWTLNVRPEGIAWGQSASPHLKRRLNGGEGTGGQNGDGLPLQAHVERAFKAPHYDIAPFDGTSDTSLSFRNALDGNERLVPKSGMEGCGADGWQGNVSAHQSTLHGRIHGWVGGLLSDTPGAKPAEFGTMQNELTSPNDPVFFLHHSQVDRLWALWQQRTDTDTSYKPESGLPHNSLHDPLRPFKRGNRFLTPADLEDIGELGYRYAAPGERVEAAMVTTSVKKVRRGRRGKRSRHVRRSGLLCRVDRR